LLEKQRNKPKNVAVYSRNLVPLQAAQCNISLCAHIFITNECVVAWGQILAVSTNSQSTQQQMRWNFVWNKTIQFDCIKYHFA